MRALTWFFAAVFALLIATGFVLGADNEALRYWSIMGAIFGVGSLILDRLNQLAGRD